MTSASTAGRLFSAWLPIFFAQGFEHAVVNMLVTPGGMVLGASITTGGWWLWNQVPVALGNLAGGLLFTAVPCVASSTARPDGMRAGVAQNAMAVEA